VELVDMCLQKKREDFSADISTLESQIDALVYECYGLTGEDIAIVEECIGK
jgi:hypothetical protein